MEGRLAGIAAAPYDAAAPLRQREALAAARRQVSARLATAPSADALTDAARIEIAEHRWQEAARLLTAAVAMAPAGPAGAAALNDLAVVQLEEARVEQRPRLLIAALAAIERAASLPAGRDVAFNRALILERCGLVEHARAAWQRYLDAEPDAAWAAEARSHLRALAGGPPRAWADRRAEIEAALDSGDGRRAAALVRSCPQSARIALETSVLGEWAGAALRGDEARAARTLRLAGAVAAALRPLSQDRLAGEAVAAIERAHGGARRALALGHQELARGYALYGREQYRSARRLFARAAADLRAAASPFAIWADFYLAACDYRAERIAAAVAGYQEVARRGAARSYLNAAGRAAWTLGLIALEQASPHQALGHLQQALQSFARTHELGNEAAVASLIANCLAYVGATDEAWRYRFRAIDAMRRADDAARLPSIYGAVARALLAQGDAAAALLYQDEALGKVAPTGDPLGLAEAFWWRAMILQAAGDEARALEDVAQARRWAARIEHAPTRRRTLAGIAVTEGAVLGLTQPRRAVATLSGALARYRRLRYSYLLIDIYWERARALLALGDFAAAEADLAAGIEELERQRARIHDAERQASYFERAQQLVEAMVRFQLVRRHDPDRAFDFVERSRARTLLDLSSQGAAGRATLAGAGGDVATAARLRRELAPGTVLVQYSLLADRLAIWTFRRGGGTFQEVRVERRPLEALATRFARAARGAAAPEEMAASSERLFQLLLAPVLDRLPEGEVVAIVPDGSLAEVPFAALRDPRDGRFLIERNPLAALPSASMLLRVEALAGRRARRRGRIAVLAVGNPAFDPRVHPTLPSLPRAADEARGLVAPGTGSRALIGKEATAARFVALLDRYDLVHFGGHAVTDGGPPSAARLVLAPGDGRASGDLTAGEIQRLRLTRPRLVVLATCGGAAGPVHSLEGVSHLARAFLAAGAPAVLAGLWEIDDRGARAFFARFYQALAAGTDATRALQAAQVEMLRNPEPELRTPRAWAGFQLLGATSPRRANP